MDRLTLDEVRLVLRVDRRLGVAVLSDIFRRAGPPDPPLDARTGGELITLELGPLLTPAMSWLASTWLPWKGKTFDAAGSRGDNVFTSDSLPVARLFSPGYRGYIEEGPETYRAFRFRTYTAPGIEDAGMVLKLDYDLPENPQSTVRRVLDELVEIDPGLYLGKAHLRGPSGRWRRVAFFTLARS